MPLLPQKTNDLFPCKPCESKRKLNIPAEFWCKEMNTYFCSICKVSMHDAIHAECEYIMESSKSAMIRQNSLLTECRMHNERMEFYCEEHMLPACNKCIILAHNRCTPVISPEDFGIKRRESTRDTSLHKDLRYCVDAMDILSKDVDKQIQSLTRDKDLSLQSLTDLRKEIEKQYSALEKELTEKLITSFKVEIEKRNKSRQKCKQLMVVMENTLALSNEDDDAARTMCLYTKGQGEVNACKEFIQELETTSRSTSLSHEFDLIDTMNSITMGKIVVHQHQRGPPSTKYSIPLSKRSLRELKRFNIQVSADKKKCSAFGIVFLSGGRIVVGDNANRKVKLFTENGEFQCDVKLSDEPSGLCLVDDCTVAVILVTDRTISVIDVPDLSMSVSSKIHISNIIENCLGVTYNSSFL
ncbi:uncharacterized protein LOC117332194 [Pecten maximus]|uniref:uncharacterized protein LOC117332194 n=1 Tax=Pecten maximus TaxID=6579 RepID=UPI001458A998|nr:uncharacterized protein LOC117332194 [Pecten maximus]